MEFIVRLNELNLKVTKNQGHCQGHSEVQCQKLFFGPQGPLNDLAHYSAYVKKYSQSQYKHCP